MKYTILSILFLLALSSTTFAQKYNAAAYEVDPLHSSLIFTVGYKMSDFSGSFGKMTGKATLEDETDFGTAIIEFSVPLASINTNSETRDSHLQGERYLNASASPIATFKSTHIKSLGNNQYAVTGDLSIAGKTLAQTILVTILDQDEVADQSGKPQTLMGVNAEFTFNRSNFGITGGLPLIGDEVAIKGSLSMVKK